MMNLRTCAKGNQHTTHKRIRYVIRMGWCVGHLQIRDSVWIWKQISCHGVILFASIVKLCSMKLEGLLCEATSWDTTPSFWLQKTFHLRTPKVDERNDKGPWLWRECPIQCKGITFSKMEGNQSYHVVLYSSIQHIIQYIGKFCFLNLKFCAFVLY